VDIRLADDGGKALALGLEEPREFLRRRADDLRALAGDDLLKLRIDKRAAQRLAQRADDRRRRSGRRQQATGRVTDKYEKKGRKLICYDVDFKRPSGTLLVSVNHTSAFPE